MLQVILSVFLLFSFTPLVVCQSSKEVEAFANWVNDLNLIAGTDYYVRNITTNPDLIEIENAISNKVKWVPLTNITTPFSETMKNWYLNSTLGAVQVILGDNANWLQLALTTPFTLDVVQYLEGYSYMQILRNMTIKYISPFITMQISDPVYQDVRKISDEIMWTKFEEIKRSSPIGAILMNPKRNLEQFQCNLFENLLSWCGPFRDNNSTGNNTNSTNTTNPNNSTNGTSGVVDVVTDGTEDLPTFLAGINALPEGEGNITISIPPLNVPSFPSSPGITTNITDEIIRNRQILSREVVFNKYYIPFCVTVQGIAESCGRDRANCPIRNTNPLTIPIDEYDGYYRFVGFKKVLTDEQDPSYWPVYAKSITIINYDSDDFVHEKYIFMTKNNMHDSISTWIAFTAGTIDFTLAYFNNHEFMIATSPNAPIQPCLDNSFQEYPSCASSSSGWFYIHQPNGDFSQCNGAIIGANYCVSMLNIKISNSVCPLSSFDINAELYGIITQI